MRHAIYSIAGKSIYQETLDWLKPRGCKFLHLRQKGIQDLTGNGNNITWARAGTKTGFGEGGWFDIDSSKFDPMGWVEAAVTNICLQSEALGTTWATSRATVGTNSTTAPDGSATADAITASTVDNAGHFIFQTITLADATNYTFSVHTKASTASWVFISTSMGAGTFAGAWFNLSTGVVGTVGAGINSTKIEPMKDGWYRISISDTSSGAAARQVRIYATNANNVTDYVQSGEAIYAWGTQLEIGAFPTSYIPTTTLAVARIQDRPEAASLARVTNNCATYAFRWFQPATVANLPGSNDAHIFEHVHETATGEDTRLKEQAGAWRWEFTDAGAVVFNLDFTNPGIGTHTFIASAASGNNFGFLNNQKLSNAGAWTWNSGGTASNKLGIGQRSSASGKQSGCSILAGVYIPNYAVSENEALQLKAMLERVAV